MKDITNTEFSNEQNAFSPFDRRSSFIDIALVFIVFSALLYNRFIGPLTPLLVLSVIPLYALLRWERLYGVILNCWPLLLIPLLAIISVFWSDAQPTTLRYGILYLLTVLPAIFIGAGCDREALLKGIFFAFALYILLCIPLGRWVGWGGSGGRAYAGLMASKNAAGDAAALSFLCSIAACVWASSYRKMRILVLAIFIMFLSLLMLWGSKATGALIASIMALPCLLLWTASRSLTRQYRTLIFIFALLAIAALVGTSNIWMPPLFEAVLESSGKDAGLTGRDILWKKADELIQQRPILGGGYKAFWIHNNLDAEYLWRAMGITTRQGFNFHNTPRDILVDLGFIGLALFIIVVLFASIKLFLKTMIKPDMTGIFCCTLLVFESPRLFFELIGFQNMHFGTVIVFVILSYGLRPNTLARIG